MEDKETYDPSLNQPIDPAPQRAPLDFTMGDLKDMPIADLETDEAARREEFDRAIAKRRAFDVSLRNEAQRAQLREHRAKVREGMIAPSVAEPTSPPHERHVEEARAAVARHAEIPEEADPRDVGRPIDPSPYVAAPPPYSAPAALEPAPSAGSNPSRLSPEEQEEFDKALREEEEKERVEKEQAEKAGS